MVDEPDFDRTGSNDSDVDADRDAEPNDFFAPRPNLGRGFDAYTPSPPAPVQYPQPGAYDEPTRSGPTRSGPTRGGLTRGRLTRGGRSFSRTDATGQVLTSPVPTAMPKRKGFARFFPWKKSPPVETPPHLSRNPFPPAPVNGQSSAFSTVSSPSPSSAPSWPYGYPDVANDEGGLDPSYSSPETAPRLWERQPYAAIAHLLAFGAVLTLAWIFGILVAQILPGRFERPPLQESVLRKSSRLVSRLWHFPQLWQSPTAETRIAAIPLPESGPVSGPIELSPIQRQPLIDELNAIETDALTLDRRLQALEKQLGRPPRQGAAIDGRINSLRLSIDPPVRSQATPDYEPTPTSPSEQLLDVVALKITLPSDALFAPGASDIQDTTLLPQILDQLVNYSEATIIVRSYSDNQTSASVSREYTLAQANALASYLQRSLPTEHRWVTLGGGPANALTDNGDAIAQQQNRRIEILVDTR
ncbi:MAG: hypothetical protein AAGM27_06705 [Cyanobacteria bacterium J06554_3]